MCEKTSYSPELTGEHATEYELSGGSLPEGLSVNKKTGALEGKIEDKKAAAAADLKITARNAAGETVSTVRVSSDVSKKCKKDNPLILIAIFLAVFLLICVLTICCSMKKETVPQPYAPLAKEPEKPAPAPVPTGLPLTWDIGNGQLKTVYAQRKPLGLIFERHNPIRITSEKDSHGKDLGILVGWTLKAVNNIDIGGMDFDSADKVLHGEVDKLPGDIPLTWDTGGNEGEKTVWAKQRPLGLTFDKELPIKITKESAGHGKDIGVKVGWVLKKINYKDVSVMNNFQDVDDLLHKEIGKLPQAMNRG